MVSIVEELPIYVSWNASYISQISVLNVLYQGEKLEEENHPIVRFTRRNWPIARDCHIESLQLRSSQKKYRKFQQKSNILRCCLVL